jgi:hypothetical protein
MQLLASTRTMGFLKANKRLQENISSRLERDTLQYFSASLSFVKTTCYPKMETNKADRRELYTQVKDKMRDTTFVLLGARCFKLLVLF